MVSVRASRTARDNGATVIEPQERQWEFLSSSADITIFGGAAGGGKTYGLLMEPLRHINNPKFRSYIFRNTFSQIAIEGGMWDDSQEIYPCVGGVPSIGKHWWAFASGARIRFGYLAHENDKFVYQGAQIPFIGWDQLEQFSGSVFFYLLSRNRSMSGVRGYVRGTCNPDAESWLANFLAWWIAEDGFADLERAGVVRWFIRLDEELIWADAPEELEGLDEDVRPKSVTFIPSTVYDNPILLARNPDYLANLKAMLPLDRARLLGDPVRGGNWKIKAGAGMIFDRDWFTLVDLVPSGGTACLYWDFASTKKEIVGSKTSRAARDPDWTAGVLIIEVAGKFWWAKTIAFRLGPAETDRRFIQESLLVWQECKRQGRRLLLRWEIEGGSAGKLLNVRLMDEFPNELDAQGVSVSGDKIVRAKPLARKAMAGGVNMILADWTERTLLHLHNQPEWPHDDIMDGGSGAFNVLVGDRKPDAAGTQVEVDLDEYKGTRWEERDGLILPRAVGRERIWGRGRDKRRRIGRRRG